MAVAAEMTDAKQDIAVGQIWSGGLFGDNKMAVVAIEGDTIYVKRADSPKKKLRMGKGAAFPTRRSEFASITLLDERWADDEEDARWTQNSSGEGPPLARRLQR